MGPGGGLDAAQSLGFIVGSCACLILSAGFAMGVLYHAVRPLPSIPAERINPNDAPVASLARLPGIGPARARAIVVLRNRLRNQSGDTPVFRSAGDLSQVKGIGPATIEGVRPWLRFDAPPKDNNEPPAG